MTLVYLGDFKFNALSLRDMPGSRSWEYAAHKVIEGLPVLQLTGRDSDTYTLNVRIHPKLGSNVRIIGALEAAGDAGEVMVLQSGVGEQLGSYVLTGLEKARTWTTPTGALIGADLALKLKEHRPEDFIFSNNIAVQGTASQTDALPTDIDDSRDPASIPMSEIVRSG